MYSDTVLYALESCESRITRALTAFNTITGTLLGCLLLLMRLIVARSKAVIEDGARGLSYVFGSSLTGKSPRNSSAILYSNDALYASETITGTLLGGLLLLMHLVVARSKAVIEDGTRGLSHVFGSSLSEKIPHDGLRSDGASALCLIRVRCRRTAQ